MNENHVVVYPYEDVWRFKPSYFNGESFSHDYPTREAAERSAEMWASRQREI